MAQPAADGRRPQPSSGLTATSPGGMTDRAHGERGQIDTNWPRPSWLFPQGGRGCDRLLAIYEQGAGSETSSNEGCSLEIQGGGVMTSRHSMLVVLSRCYAHIGLLSLGSIGVKYTDSNLVDFQCKGLVTNYGEGGATKWEGGGT